MSAEEDVVPMEEEATPPDSSSSNDSASMDWAKIDEKTGAEESHKIIHQASNMAASDAEPLAPQDVDEFSFGSSDADSDGGEGGDGLEKLADVSSETTYFDMELLQDCIKKSKDALDLVVGKEVIMVVGKTGVGKSTLIQGIAGRQIQTSFHSSSFSGQTATKTVFEAHDALPNFEIGHAKVSKTRCLSAFMRKDGENEVVWVDSPGLEDTRGVEMDIATSALLSQVSKRCKSLRFVILIHCASLLEDRGNAFRSVLQFANKFVKVFDDSTKRSFMFLFTHTDVITGMADGRMDAKKCLQDEIIQIADATKDGDVLEVLEYVRKSLKKNYPFADVLHPLHTDYAKLASDATRKLLSVTDLSSASTCNLTLPSKMKLEVAVQNLLDGLQAALVSSSLLDVDQVEAIQQKLHYLREYVDVESVRGALFQSEEIINDYKKALNATIELEFSRWTDTLADFDKGNASALRDALRHLEPLDNTFLSTRWIESKNDDLLQLQGAIVRKVSTSERVHRELKKLQVWTEEFECCSIFSDTCKKVMALVDDAVSFVSKTDPSALPNYSPKELALFLDKFSLLHMCISAEETAIPDMNFEHARASLEKKTEAIKQFVQSCASRVTDLSESTTLDVNNDLSCVALKAHFLESMEISFTKLGVSILSLDEIIVSTLRSLEQDVIALFKSCCNEMKTALNYSTFDPLWKPKLHWLQSTCNGFSKLRGDCWKEMPSVLSVVINQLKSVLYHLTGELENMSQVTKVHGMMSGKRLGEDLVMFRKCKWFDSFLPPSDAFVANCCIAIEYKFQERIQKKSAELDEAVIPLHKMEHDCSGPIEKLGLLIPELKEIDVFLAITDESPDMSLNEEEKSDGICVVGVGSEKQAALKDPKLSNLKKKRRKDRRAKASSSNGDTKGCSHRSSLVAASLASSCEAHLERYTRDLSERANKITDDWNAKIGAKMLDRMTSLAPEVDLIYANATSLSNLQSIPVIAQESKRIMELILIGCKKLSSLAESELNHFGGDFKVKAGILKAIKSCNGLLHLKNHLPDYNEAQHQVRNLVAREAQKLEAEIETSSDWEMIDQSVEVFESAVILDNFVSHEATARLSTLRRLREKKEGQVDEYLQEMISANNFKGMFDFLSPLAVSKDQIKKQKFESYQDEIVFKLDLMIKEVKCCLSQESLAHEDVLKSIARNMNILVSAKASLQRLLHRKLNIASEIGNMRGSINSQLNPLLDQIFSSVNKKDFVRAALMTSQVTLYVRHLDDYIRPPNKRRQKDAKSKYQQELNRVTGYVDKFFQSTFEENKDLLRSLTSLKQAKESSDDAMRPLASSYDDTKKALMDRVGEFVATVEGSLFEAKCYDDIIPLLRLLLRHISGQFKIHVPTELLMECEHLYERIQKEKRDHEQQLEFGDKHVEEIIELWGRELDKLQSQLKTPYLFKRLLWGSNADKASYRNMKNRLLTKVERRLKQAYDSLASRDLRSVQESMEFLDLIVQKLQKHVGGVGVKLNKLRERCKDSFIHLCNEIKAVLDAREIFRFEEKFAEYRGFTLHVPCILSCEKCKKEFALVNQILYGLFASEIDSFLSSLDAEVFDFASIRVAVLRLRKSGDFIADRLTLLNEEVPVNDRWLGKLQDLCSKHFSCGRDFGKLKFCLELGVVPSARAPAIRKAYKEKARQCHPDKMGNNSSGDAGEMFRSIKEAQDQLLFSDHLKDRSQAFDEALKGIGQRLRALSNQFMDEQQYEMTKHLLFQLPALKELDNLVVPKLKSGETQSSVREIVKGHVEKMRVEVNTHWSERRYKDLNDSISDLKQMESHLKSYPDIFSTSWNTGIVQSIETEIETLGQKARACLQSHSIAKKREGDFRRFFIEMGSVLVELPSFKAFTKHVMSNILESCLDSAWGYSFLFEFGLSLQRGGEYVDDNSKRIAQMLVGEFVHFKEVLTMCWNEETSQKPVEDVVMNIKGEHRKSANLTEEMNIDHMELIKCFKLYDKNYKSLLGEYIRPEADLNTLVQKMSALSQSMQPISCDKMWSQKEKETIPILLAGVFSLFTVLKSGASYNRIESAAGSPSLGEKLLMKPHNIQVLTLLYMFGCGKGPQSSIDSQLMQIRTGEGKSMILGAAAVIFALLVRVRVRVVCYSEYLSTRDFRLFEEVFRRFGVLEDIAYSKITAFAEDSTAAKGNIRALTESLLRGNLRSANSDLAKKRATSPEVGKRKKQKTQSALITSSSVVDVTCEYLTGKGQEPSAKDEVLLVDEVDVFFGSEFYGKTYNQVIEFKEPEVATILKRIWEVHCKGGHRLRLKDVKAMPVYTSLLKKMPPFGFLLDNEISLMLSQVKKVDDVPYYLDSQNDRIGYKVMDSISYNVTFGYSTIFAYLKEADKMTNKTAALSRALVMPISCGQFSYANITPKRILGVSGTLEAIGQYEKNILNKYGLEKFVYVPSVYGDSNFHFDKAGNGIYLETDKSNFYHRISAEVMVATKSKRAVIVFFRDRAKLNEFVASPTYRKLGRHKSLLTEDMSSAEKEYVISQAATSGQITLSTAVFGRGTDFFCKDEVVEKGGGVLIIQTFLSEEASEEVQIQGRTARQGKRGSYQMILVHSDLTDFGIQASEKDKVPRNKWYEWLCEARLKYHEEQCLLIENNLQEATEKDRMTHDYFNSLLAQQESKSMEQFKNLYELIKKPPVPSLVSIDLALVIDITGSMAPHAHNVVSTVESLLIGQNALTSKLAHNFPETEFQLQLACLGFRDIDDGSNQFTEALNNGSHFTNDITNTMYFVKSICASSSGGFDLAEDIVGALQHCASWHGGGDWTSDMKFMMLFTDASAHGLFPQTSGPISNSDNYSVRHPAGLTAIDAVTSMISKDIDMFFCSFNPFATARTEEQFSQSFKSHPDNSAEHGVTSIPMVPPDAIESSHSSILGSCGRHIIFVLDESGSMKYSWSGVVAAYNQYISKRKQNQSGSDFVSVVQFDGTSRITVQQQPIFAAPEALSYSGGGTAFHPAAVDACKLARGTPRSHTPAIIFMSDGEAYDAANAAMEFSSLNNAVYRMSNSHLELHVIAFGSGTNQAQLQQIASASRAGKVHASSNTAELASVFVSIATTQNVSLLLESEITKKISEAVSDIVSLEYFGN